MAGLLDSELVIRAATGLLDQSGNGHNAAEQNGSVPIVSKPGHNGDLAFSFDGSSSLTFGNKFDGSAELSVGFWVWQNRQSGLRAPFAKGSYYDTNGSFGCRYDVGKGRLQYSIRRQSFIFKQPSLNFASWTHVALVHSQDGMQMYLDGDLVTPTHVSGTYGSVPTSTFDFWIGRETSGRRWVGLIDDFQLSYRPWTSAEISRWYSHGRGYDPKIHVDPSSVIQPRAAFGPPLPLCPKNVW